VLGAVQEEVGDGLVCLSAAGADWGVGLLDAVEVLREWDVPGTELQEEDGETAGEIVGEVEV
jgi:hypothetical protein